MNRYINIYEPNKRLKIGFFKSWFYMIRNLILYRELIIQLFKRDFFAVYKKSFMGIAWIFISPVMGIISWVFMNKTGILKPGDVGIPYPAYVLLSSSIWGLFMGFYNYSTQTLLSGRDFLLQVNFAHEALLIKQTAQHLANYILSFILIIIVLILYGIMPNWRIAFFPILILPLFLLGSGIGLVISLVSVIASDLSKGFNILFGLLMYITPVIYSPNPENIILKKIITWNPLAYLIGFPRDIIIYGKIENIDKYFYSSLFSFLIFIIAWRIFFVSEDKVIERIL